MKAPGAVAGRLAWTTGWVLGLAALPAQPAPPFVSGVWCGNVTPAGATVCVRLGSPGLQVRLAVGAVGPFRPDQYSAPVTTTAAAGNVVRLDIGGLRPATAYAYGIEVNGVLREEPLARGTFRTFPEGPASFRIAFGSCGDWRAADHRAYEAVAAAEPLVFLHLGDLHYSDTATTAAEDYRRNYDAILRHPQQSVLFRAQAVAYVWDDHDFNGNDSDGSSPGRAAARSVYRDYVPHYPLIVPDGTIGQAFTIGRVRVILTDLRSAAHPATDAESARKTRLGAAQKAWFKRELLAARDAGVPLILWGSSVPWIHPAQVGDDSWGGYATERAELADFLRQNRIRNVVVLAGDMHALAYDDGTHADYATGGGAPLVVLHASALNSAGSVKGGPYTAGPLPGPAHYGLLDITDSGGPTLAVRFLAQRVDEGTRLGFAFTAGPAGLAPLGIPVQPAGEERAFVNVSTRARIHTPGEAVIVGFVVGGNAPRHVLARAIGPALGPFGVADALPRPHLRLRRDGVVLASNDQWARADARQLSAVFERTGAFPLPESSADAALVFPLAPGAYTLEATGLGNGTGTVLLEAYGVP